SRGIRTGPSRPTMTVPVAVSLVELSTASGRAAPIGGSPSRTNRLPSSTPPAVGATTGPDASRCVKAAATAGPWPHSKPAGPLSGHQRTDLSGVDPAFRAAFTHDRPNFGQQHEQRRATAEDRYTEVDQDPVRAPVGPSVHHRPERPGSEQHQQ